MLDHGLGQQPYDEINKKINDAFVISAKYGHKEIVEMLLKTPNIDINMKGKVCFIDICETQV